MWNTRRTGLSQAGLRRGNQGSFRNLPAAMQAMPQTLDDQRMGGRSLEIRPLSTLLSPGTDHVERAILPPAALDGDHAAVRRDALPMPGMPLQFRQFSPLQGKAKLARRRRAGDGRAFGNQAVDVSLGLFSVRTNPTLTHGAERPTNHPVEALSYVAYAPRRAASRLVSRPFSTREQASRRVSTRHARVRTPHNCQRKTK